jgi:uncharacterized protein
MGSILSALAAGLVFGLGLTVSGMINPQKVLGFLDIFGAWDPTLALVMGGAVLVTLPGFRLLQRKGAPFFSGAFHFPTRTDLDVRLIGGAALFGVGWGMVGFCPGPALAAFGGSIVSPGVDTGSILLFVLAMLTGLLAPRFFPAIGRPSDGSTAVRQDG